MSHPQCGSSSEQINEAADDEADKRTRRIQLMTPPAVNALMTNNNKDFISQGAAGAHYCKYDHHSTFHLSLNTHAEARTLRSPGTQSPRVHSSVLKQEAAAICHSPAVMMR